LQCGGIVAFIESFRESSHEEQYDCVGAELIPQQPLPVGAEFGVLIDPEVGYLIERWVAQLKDESCPNGGIDAGIRDEYLDLQVW
jgi:hypothetical protein